MKIDRDSAWEAWCALRPDSATAAKILSALNVWKASGRWAEEGGRYIPQADKFLSKGYWKSPPSAAPAPMPEKRRQDADEVAAIHQMMEEPL